MIILNDIVKQFSDGNEPRCVLNHLSMHVEAGEFVAITGDSGTGKTTLLSILATLLPIDGGEYRLDGKLINNVNGSSDSQTSGAPSSQKSGASSVADNDIATIRNHKIGMVFQDHRLLPQFSALQNILIPCLAEADHVNMEQTNRAIDLMRFMGIEPLKHQSVEHLSGGEKTRVAICRALINKPAVLLADEPTGQLDETNAQIIAELFRKVNEEMNTTIIMVTHSDRMACAAHKQYRLTNGTLIEC